MPKLTKADIKPPVITGYKAIYLKKQGRTGGLTKATTWVQDKVRMVSYQSASGLSVKMVGDVGDEDIVSSDERVATEAKREESEVKEEQAPVVKRRKTVIEAPDEDSDADSVGAVWGPDHAPWTLASDDEKEGKKGQRLETMDPHMVKMWNPVGRPFLTTTARDGKVPKKKVFYLNILEGPELPVSDLDVLREREFAMRWGDAIVAPVMRVLRKFVPYKSFADCALVPMIQMGPGKFFWQRIRREVSSETSAAYTDAYNAPLAVPRIMTKGADDVGSMPGNGEAPRYYASDEKWTKKDDELEKEVREELLRRLPSRPHPDRSLAQMTNKERRERWDWDLRYEEAVERWLLNEYSEQEYDDEEEAKDTAFQQWCENPQTRLWWYHTIYKEKIGTVYYKDASKREDNKRPWECLR